ncbi:MAG TPA: hypothetical protein VIO59_03595 [Rhodanobacter sp.]
MRFPENLARWPTVPLERPFRLFGRTFEVLLSSRLTIEPMTLMWILTGHSFQHLAHEAGVPADLFKMAKRGIIQGQKLSSTTLAPWRRGLAPLLPPGFPEQSSLIDLIEAIPKASAWAMFLRGIGDHEGEGLCSLARGFADTEAMLSEAMALHEQGRKVEADSMLVEHVGTPWLLWMDHGIPSPLANLPLDVLCQQLAAWNTTSGSGYPRWSALTLLKAGKTPMGHWLQHQRAKAGCGSLQKMANRLQGADYERLKAWSSGRDLMPPGAAEAILAELGGGGDADMEMARYRWARLLSFLCEFVISATPDKAPTWPEAQALVERRYSELVTPAASNAPAVD